MAEARALNGRTGGGGGGVDQGRVDDGNGGRNGEGAIQRRHAPSHNGGDYGQ